jgi:hypothetical protein
MYPWEMLQQAKPGTRPGNPFWHVGRWVLLVAILLALIDLCYCAKTGFVSDDRTVARLTWQRRQ